MPAVVKMSRGRQTIDFSSLSFKDPSSGRDSDVFSGRDSDIRNSREKSGSFRDSKIRRSSFFGKGRMSSFFFGQDESDSFYFDKSASEVEKNIKRAPWYRSLSKWDKNQLGMILEKVEDSEQVELQELINVNINPFLLQFSTFSTEMDYRERSFYKYRGEAKLQNALTSFFDVLALVYDLVLISKECKDESFKMGLYCGLHFVLVFCPTILVMLKPKILSFAGENYKGLMDGAFIGSTLSISGILKVVMLSCLNDLKDVYHYILVYLVYYIIAKSTAFQILFQSYIFAVGCLLFSQLALLALEDNLFFDCNPIAIVMAIGVIMLYSMGYYAKEKLSRTMYLVDNAKRMQLLKIKDHFKRMKSHMKTRSRRATEKFEVDFRSPIEKSLGILKTLRDTDEGKRIEEELEFVISTLKKSTNTSWTPELLASAQQMAGMTGDNYKNAVAGWLQTYKKDHVKDVVVRAKSASVSALRPPDLAKYAKAFTPSGIKVIPEEEEKAEEKAEKDKAAKGEGEGEGEAEKKDKAKETTEGGATEQKKVDLGKELTEKPEEKEEVDPLLAWLEDPAEITTFFGLPKPTSDQKVKNLESAFKPYTIVGKFLNQELGNWNLNIFKLYELAKERPLMFMIEFTFRELGLDMVFNIERETLIRFADMMDRGYKDNPYHNSTHAADVLHNMYCLLKGPPLCDFLTDLDILACLYAAIIHDLAHPGVNNALMISTSTMQACLYHDKSVLENYHLAPRFLQHGRL